MGAVATAAGAALAVRYGIATGPTIVTVLGAATALVGLVGLAAGLRRSWQALHRWSRLLLLPLLLVLVLPATSVGLAVAYATSPPSELGAATPADQGLSFHDVTMRTEDGARLAGWYVPSRGGAAVVLLHGAGNTRTAVLQHANVLAEHGFGVLLIDARGHGESTGVGMDLGWYGDADVRAAVDYLHGRAGITPGRVGVVGLSMGGEEAIGAAAADPRIAAVVAEGATARTASDKDQWLPGGTSGTVQRWLDRLTYGLTDLLSPASPPTPLHDAVRRANHAEFLLITAGEVPDETRAARAFADQARERVQVWTVAGAGHTQGLAVDPRGWTRRVVDFLDLNLR
jgi:pimeloyl-ACP methyl ester carboxylesterase